ncbi:disease resistance protein RUN1 isoform X3 [Medicago truncatula]|uniref:disease resistance protein RUN1 isoform X3 n=1 Tax=Medicago truncatula TaxID=3880 RepID=UPI001967198C|nr:disease resistance protein RUN1 isoform X3 [Medicago truncatula]
MLGLSKPEFEMIEKIVEAVIKKLGRTFSGSTDDLIGIQPHIEALENLLKLSSEDDGCRVLGIWGMDGIGKTTLATVLYDKISFQFDACCFIENVSKIYEDGGAVAVQKQIICQTIEEKNIDTCSARKISQTMRNRLCKLKLLIVLDNVEQLEQLEKLDIEPKFLHPRSKIIIITRDKHILQAYGADEVFEAKLMNDEDAHKLLCRKAFKSDYPSSGFAELIPKVLVYAQRLPLAVKVLGSFLFSRNANEWSSTLDKFEKNPPNKIMKALQVSYEGLEKDEKEVFLHVACFFNGERKDYVSRILDACELNPGINIRLLAEKSLITIRNEEIHIHEMLHKLGKQIVQEQHPHKPKLWSRMWLYRDFHHAMITNSEAIKAKAIILNQKEDVSKFNKLRAEDLSKLENLEVLILYKSKFSGKPTSLSDSLCYLLWNGYPFTSLPSNFQPHRLVELNMPDSSIKQLWIGPQYLPNLRRMDLSNSKNLKMTPCFEGILNLERLDFTGCINLSHVDPSIGLLTELVFLSFQRCASLVSLNFGRRPLLKSLKVLCLSDCTKLEYTSDFSGLVMLQYLDMDRCASISRIHEFVETLGNLSYLSLRDCTNLVEIPCMLECYIPLKSLIYLDLSFCNISKVPDAIGELKSLERLNLQGNKFTSVPSTYRLKNLSYLNLSHCHMLQSSSELPTANGPSDLLGRYFETTSQSHNHRSGLYIVDSPNYTNLDFFWSGIGWMQRLVKEPRHFRCGFDIVIPWLGHDYYLGNFNFKFKGGLDIVRIENSFSLMDCVGCLFFVKFEVNNCHEVSGSPLGSFSSPLPHPFYLSFESEYTEERFDMPLDLEINKVDGKKYLWVIYISRKHCHFVKTGAHITFKARQGLIIKKWGLHAVANKLKLSIPRDKISLPLQIVKQKERSSSIEPKIQLPYNWYVCDEDEVEMKQAKGKETDLFNLGLIT